MKVLVRAFNKEKAQVWAFSSHCKTSRSPVDSSYNSPAAGGHAGDGAEVRVHLLQPAAGQQQVLPPTPGHCPRIPAAEQTSALQPR